MSACADAGIMPQIAPTQHKTRTPHLLKMEKGYQQLIYTSFRTTTMLLSALPFKRNTQLANHFRDKA